MKIELVVISGRTLDTEPSVMIQCENLIYVFNIPDQTQRVYMENKWKMSKIKQFFITDASSSAIGGFPGLIQTVTNGGQPNFGITAPNKVVTIINHLINAHYLPDGFKSLSSEKFSDEFLTVTAIPLETTTAFDVGLCNEPGKFDVKKAKELGLTPGPQFKKLIQGESIVLEDGRVIEPSMCVGLPIPGARILFVNCKTMGDFEKMNSIDGVKVTDFDFIVHFTPSNILTSEVYRNFFAKSHQNQQICFLGKDKITFKTICQLFSKISPQKLAFGLKEETDPTLKSCFAEGELGLSYTFAPAAKRQFNFVKEKKGDKFDTNDEGSTLPNCSSFALTFLGTGCKMPTKLRNVSGILLHIPNNKYAVLDAGEGFVGQLHRKYGYNNATNILKNLSFVFASHEHGDHVFGIHRILELHHELTDETIPVFADEEIINDLKGRGEFNVQYINRDVNNYEIKDQDNIIISLEFFSVKHIEGARGIVLTIGGKFRVAYSGDRSIDDDFVKGVKNCDILIHEATFSDDMKDEAAARGHSTIGQAIEVGKQLSAKYVVLTHISARYQLEHFQLNEKNALFAYDYLSFSFEDADSTCEMGQQAFLEILNTEEKETNE